MSNLHTNAKQHGCSVGGYTQPSAEILIKASWHLKPSVTRQPIWAKRAPCWLSYIRPTPETGTTQANKAASESRHLFLRSDVRYRSAVTAGRKIVFHRRVLCTLLTLLHVCHMLRLDWHRDTEQRPLTYRRWWLLVQRRGVGAKQTEELRDSCCALAHGFQGCGDKSWLSVPYPKCSGVVFQIWDILYGFQVFPCCIIKYFICLHMEVNYVSGGSCVYNLTSFI